MLIKCYVFPDFTQNKVAVQIWKSAIKIYWRALKRYSNFRLYLTKDSWV